MENTNTKKAPFFKTWIQVLLGIFFIGIWNFVWESRIALFASKLQTNKKDEENQTLLAMIVPFFGTFWFARLVKTINSGLSEEEKRENGYSNIPLALVIIIEAIVNLVAILMLGLIVVVCIVLFTSTPNDFTIAVTEAFGMPMGLALVLCVVGLIYIPSLIQLPALAIIQNKINKVAEIKGIENTVPYSARTVGTPYTSPVKVIILGILTGGLWFCFGWVSMVTAFLNRVCDEKRNKGEESLMCFCVPLFFPFWAKKTAELVDDFSARKENPKRIAPAIKFLSKIATVLYIEAIVAIVYNAFVSNPISIAIASVVLALAVASYVTMAAIIQVQLNNDVYMREVESEGILEIRHLRKCFSLNKTMFGSVTKELTAVNDVSFVLKAGETLGIVGESGCGKTTMGRTILKLYPSEEGEIIFDGKDITFCPDFQTRQIRTDMQIIFQDPYSSLPPRSTVGDILSEPVLVHNIVPKHKAKEYVLDLMEKCGLRDYYYERYPHEFSGGQRQRICIARALSVKPKLVICDEPVSALDVSIQAQVINLLKDLQKSMGLTYLFISHDLSVVKFISDKIGVMYLGVMVEFGNKKEIFDNPLHPYTKALFSAIPNPDPDHKMQRITLTGDIPSPANPPSGCCFHTRCPHAMDICKCKKPEYREYEPGHFAACHLYPQD